MGLQTRIENILNEAWENIEKAGKEKNKEYLYV
jgi:hypothetical protein